MPDGNLQARNPEPVPVHLGGRAWRGFSADLHATTPGRYPGGQWPEHRLILQIGGPVRAECRCDGLSMRGLVRPGEFDVVPAGAQGSWEDEDPAEMLILKLQPAFLKGVAQGLDMHPDRFMLAPRLQARDPRVEHIAWALKAEFESPSPDAQLYGDSLGVALAAHLLRAYSTGRAPAPIRHGLSPRRRRLVLEHIEAHLDRGMSLAELAAVAGCSVSHFNTQFRRSTGRSAHQYIVEQRVRRARDLLVAGEASIAQAALAAGFAHQSHLARWMRRILGVTPAELLRSC